MMDAKPIMIMAHARSRSSALERLLIQNYGHANCLHEPFGDAYYLGPERQHHRYNGAAIAKDFSQTTFESTVEDILLKNEQCMLNGKRLVVKEMAFFLFPGNGESREIAPSFGTLPREPQNPTLIPRAELAKIHYVFLVRHPYLSVPSYYRLSTPDRRGTSRVDSFGPDDLGYGELRALYNYVKDNCLAPADTCQDDAPNQSRSNGRALGVPRPCIFDAEDLIERPREIISAMCQETGLAIPDLDLHWDSAEDHKNAAAVIDKWSFHVSFHDNVMKSTRLEGKRKNAIEDAYTSWVKEFGTEGANFIQKVADSQMDDYLYLKKLAYKPAS